MLRKEVVIKMAQKAMSKSLSTEKRRLLTT
jgi:hypothetical protein